MHDGVVSGAAGRLCTGVQTGIPLALLDVFRERVHHLPLLRAGETLPLLSSIHVEDEFVCQQV